MSVVRVSDEPVDTRRTDLTEAIRFTRHAREKLLLLAKHGFTVTEAQIVDAVLHADRVEDHNTERIAQKAMIATHVLRVVYRTEGDQIVIITLYTSRRKRYESEV